MTLGHSLKFEEILQTKELLSHGAHEGRIELHGLYPKGYLLLQRQELGA
jgi:hypothetical protein